MFKVEFPNGDIIETDNVMDATANYINSIKDTLTKGKDFIVCLSCGETDLHEVFCFDFIGHPEKGVWLRPWWDGKSNCKLNSLASVETAYTSLELIAWRNDICEEEREIEADTELYRLPASHT